MGKKIVRTIAVSFCFLAVMGLFQNCGKGFESIGPGVGSLSSSGAGLSGGLPAGLSANAKAYDRDPYSDANLTAADFDFDFSSFTKLVKLQHLQDTDHFTNGVVNLGFDDQFPTLIPTPTENLQLAPMDPKFQHVNAYYHLDTLINQLVAAKQFSPTFTPLKVNPHCTAGDFAVNNAYYSSQENLLCMGYANPDAKQIWSADDSDVLVHEFGHFLNHKYSTDAIMGSTWETGAMDEGLADVWAYRQSESPVISEWYGRAILAAFFALDANYSGLRDLTTTPVYPALLEAEVHADSTFISTLLYNIKEDQPKVTKEQLSYLTKRILESLQVGDGFGAAIKTLRTEAVKIGVPQTYIDGLLTQRGLLRKDDLTSVAIEATPVIMDNHAFTGISVGGNCNKALDAGETTVVYVDLKNAGASDIGQVYTKLSTDATAVSILPGGEIGSLFRIMKNSSYLASEIQSQNKRSANYDSRLFFASFIVKANANAAGPYTFNLQLSGMNSIDNTPVNKTLTFTLNVGNVATRAQNCPGTQEQDVFP